MHLVFARNAARDAGDQAAVRQAIDHGEFFRQPQRVMQRDKIAVDQELQFLGALRRRRGHQVRRIHQAVGRGVMLVKADAVIAELVEFFPRIEMLRIGLGGFLRIEMRLAERVGQRRAGLQLVEVDAVRQQVEDEDLHGVSSIFSARKLAQFCGATRGGRRQFVRGDMLRRTGVAGKSENAA